MSAAGKAERIWQLIRDRRLPDRLESRLYEKRWYRRFWVRTSFKGVLRTPPLACDPRAEAELHSLVCNRDLYQYLASIKPFLRFYQRVAVVSHDDGTLTDMDRRLLAKHVPGIVILPSEVSDRVTASALASHPHCARYRNQHFIARQLFDALFR